jgi:hypothetical protein
MVSHSSSLLRILSRINFVRISLKMPTMGGITSTTTRKGNIEMHPDYQPDEYDVHSSMPFVIQPTKMPDFYFGHVPGTVRFAPWVKPAVIGGLVGIVLTVLIHVL